MRSFVIRKRKVSEGIHRRTTEDPYFFVRLQACLEVCTSDDLLGTIWPEIEDRSIGGLCVGR